MATFLVPAGDSALAEAAQSDLRTRAVSPREPVPASWARQPWLVSEPGSLLPFLAIPGFRGRRLLSLSPVSAAWRPILDAAFGGYLAHSGTVNLGPIPDLLEILATPDAIDRAIAVAGAPRFGLTLWRGDLSSLAAPVSMFRPTPEGLVPDFEHAYVTDGGQTIALGEYEAAVDAILYELDPRARTRLLANEIGADRSFGAALRRLRLIRGLSLVQVPGLNAAEMEVLEALPRPPARDIQIRLARALRVRVAELGAF